MVTISSYLSGQALHSDEGHVAESLARVETKHPEAAPACQRGRALLMIVGGLIDDSEILRGAALFPVLEAGAVDEAEAASIFGQTAAEMGAELIRVDALGETARQLAGAPSAAQAEALRQMLLVVIADPRLLLIRLAAQLARLREGKHAPPEERERLALDTREIFAPLASRLGVWQLKWELEDLAFRYLEPEQYHRVASWLASKRADRERYIAQVVETIGRELEAAGVHAYVSGRPKHIYSIWRKMQRKGVSFDELYDVRAVRIIVDTLSDCYAALGVVHGLWRYIPGEFDDYIATPKSNGYRSLHTAVVGPETLPVEIQIRTGEMHEHSELGVAAHWRYKEGRGRTERAYEQKIAWLRQILEPSDGIETPTDFLERVRTELFEDRVYVLSPRGEVIVLPQGATPLDYAYQVHTELGHRCRGAKVNGRMVPLTRVLENGEQVEILAGKQPEPSRDWLVPSLGYLVSPRNRAKVRAWFRKLDESQNRAQGRQLLERELARLGGHGMTMPELIAELRLQNADQLYLALGEGEITVAQVAGAVQRRTRRQAAAGLDAQRSREPSADAAEVQIESVGDLLSTYAGCCKPVPPEPIAGYVTVGRGVTVHRRDCANLRRLEESSPERLLSVEWGARSERIFPVEIAVRAYDRRGLVRDISAVLADAKLNIHGMSTLTNEQDGCADIRIRISVGSLSDLSRVLNRIQSLPNVMSATRQA